MNAYSSEDIDRLEPAYLKSYGLQEAPFSTVHHDKFMYLDAERAQRINMLQHMVRYSNLLLIVQGVHGVGKTALLKKFIQNAEPDWQLCEIAANTMIDAEQLLFQAAQGFGVRQLPQDASELQEMLYARVATFHHNDQIPILIIDDAHELPKDALLAIFNLADAYVNDVNLLRIILFCEPQIDKIIDSKDVRALRERVTHTMEIPPLDEEGTAEYLKHRMAAAGFNGSSPFTPKLIKKIFRTSQGIPARINALAHQALEEGDVQIEDEQRMQHESETRMPVIMQGKPAVYITAAILLLVIAIVFQDQINSIFEEETGKNSDVALMEQADNNTPLATPAQTSQDNKEQVTTELNIQERIISLSEPKPEAVTNDTATPKAAPESAISETVVVDDSVAEVANDEVVDATQQQTEQVPAGSMSEGAPEFVQSISVDAINPNPVPTSRNKQTISISGQGFTPQSEVIISWTGNEKKLVTSQVSLVNENQIDITITVGMNEDNWSVWVIDPKAGKSNSSTFKVTQFDQGYQKDKWILAQDPEGFTLQLFGTNKKENADQFINQHKLADQVGYFYTVRDGKDWYSVVYGAYPDKATAQQAVTSLPSTLKVKPWVRRFDDIQASVNASRKVVQRKKPKPVVTSPTTAPTTIPIAGANGNAAQNEAWLWSQDPTSFTLQLLGARQSTSIQKFLRKYSNLNGKAVYFHTRHDSQDWYAVVYGVYADRKQAQQAIKRLPQELQTASPWIRSFGSIHAELDRAE